MRTKIIYLALMLSIFGMFSSTNIQAGEIDSVVSINETTFPDNYIRWYVAKVVDINGDGKLQQDEIDRIECIKININEDFGPNHPFCSKTVDCRGLEIFTNMKVLYVAPHIIKGCNIYNIDVIYSMPKLEELYIAGWHQKGAKLDLSKHTKLKELRLYSISNLNELNLSKNTKLTDIDICDISGNAVIDLSNLKSLENV